jgi:branched-subunit amino acid transport protein
VSWAALLGLSAGCYTLKALGPVLLGAREPGPRMQSVLRLLAVPLLAALVATQTVADGTELTLDARVPALLVAAVLVWRRASFLLVVLAAAATAAGLRLL